MQNTIYCQTGAFLIYFGLQSYAKTAATFGSCLKKCEPAKQGNGTWTCKPLGLQNRCADFLIFTSRDAVRLFKIPTAVFE